MYHKQPILKTLKSCNPDSDKIFEDEQDKKEAIKILNP